MSLELHLKNDVLTFKLSGDLDQDNAALFKERFEPYPHKEDIKCICFDFKNIRFINSYGLGILIYFYKKYCVNKHRIILKNLNSVQLRLIRNIKLDKLFKIEIDF